MDLQKRIDAFVKLGKFLSYFKTENYNPDLTDSITKKHFYIFNEIIKNCNLYNKWFIEENVRYAITSISKCLTEDNIQKWIYTYSGKIKYKKKAVRVGVVMAGNIPIVGFHDFLCVLISGNKFIGKLSSQDNKLLPAIINVLTDIEPEFKDFIELTEDRLTSFDAIIATGSNNTSRYFEYYFGKYKNIIRKNRNAVAVLSGNETLSELKALSDDIFMYFGLGCRNVSKIFIHKHYSFEKLFQAFEKYRKVIDLEKYKNNYDYYKSVYLINKTNYIDNGFTLLKEDSSFSSPISVLYYEFYDDKDVLNNYLENNSDKIQCIISNDKGIKSAVPMGTSQNPGLSDYADGIDTMEFLLKL